MKHIICPACGNTDLRRVESRYELPFDGTLNERQVTYLSCRRCGLATKRPFPSENDLKSYYMEQWQSASPRPSECLSDAAGWIRGRSQPYTVEAGDIVDVGCKDLSFASKIANLFDNTGIYAIDPGSANKVWAGGEEDKTLDDVDRWRTSNAASIVTATHVLEHVLDPHQFLMDIAGIVTRSGGLIYLEVPALEYSSHSSMNIVRSHLWHFSLTSMILLCCGPIRDAGFSVVAAETVMHPVGWPTNRILLRKNDPREYERGAWTAMLMNQSRAQERKILKWIEKVKTFNPSETVLYGATEWLMWALRCDPLSGFEVVDLYKSGEIAGRKIRHPREALPEKKVALLCTSHFNSVQSITRYLAEHYPSIEVIAP